MSRDRKILLAAGVIVLLTFIFGYAGLVDGMVARIKREMGSNPKVIATGGLAELIRDVSDTIEAVEPLLTLDGLRIIAEELEGNATG